MCVWTWMFQPLGASDYLEMSRLFDTVFIRHIPLLTLNKKTQARRLITLVDALYDHKVRRAHSCSKNQNLEEFYELTCGSCFRCGWWSWPITRWRTSLCRTGITVTTRATFSWTIWAWRGWERLTRLVFWLSQRVELKHAAESKTLYCGQCKTIFSRTSA